MYIVQKLLKTKTKDISGFATLKEAMLSVRDMQYIGTSYIGAFPTYRAHNGSGARYRIIGYNEQFGMVCSLSEKDRAMFASLPIAPISSLGTAGMI